MSNSWAIRGLKRILLDKKLNKPRNKNRSYQLKSRSWMRRITAADNKSERLEFERNELKAGIEDILNEVINLRDDYPAEAWRFDQEMINRLESLLNKGRE